MKTTLALSLFLSTTTLFSDDVCPRCEKIREYNAAHPENNYYYYEDYVAAQKKKVEELKKVSENETSKSKKEKQIADAKIM